MPSAKLSNKFRKIRLLLLDVDGVLTDGRIYVGDAVANDGQPIGLELKAFHVQDGHGMKMVIRAGLHVGWVSSRYSPVTARRAKELGIDRFWQPAPGQKPPPAKLEIVRAMATELGVGLDQVCFVGDDLVDLPVLRSVGLPVAVADAVEEVRQAAAYVTVRPGGHAAVREVVELLLKSQGLWDGLLSKYRVES